MSYRGDLPGGDQPYVDPKVERAGRLRKTGKRRGATHMNNVWQAVPGRPA